MVMESEEHYSLYMGFIWDLSVIHVMVYMNIAIAFETTQM